MSVLPYLVKNFLLGMLLVGVLWLITSPVLIQVGVKAFGTFDPSLRARVGECMGDRTMIEIELNYVCMFVDIANMIQTFAPIMLGVMIVAVLIKTYMTATTRGGY